MKFLLDLIQDDKDLEKELSRPWNTFWDTSKLVGSGSRGQVYDLDETRVVKVQEFQLGSRLFVQKPHLLFIQEPFLLEAIVMQVLDGSELLPKIFDVMIQRATSASEKSRSIIIMEKIKGSPYRPETLGINRCKDLWKILLENLQLLYSQCSFIHGDLIQTNLVLQNQKLTLIDFGHASLVHQGTLVCNYYSFQKKLIPMVLSDKKMLRLLQTLSSSTLLSCPVLVHFLQEHRKSIDICKLLSYALDHVSPGLRKKLKTCTGPSGVLSETRKPNPIYYSHQIISYQEAVEGLFL